MPVITPTGGGGGGGSSSFIVASKRLTSAQILSLHATPVLLDGAPAPGTGKGYAILGIWSQVLPADPQVDYVIPNDARLEVGPLAAVNADVSYWETVAGFEATPSTGAVLNGSGLFYTTAPWTPNLAKGSFQAFTLTEDVDNQPLAIGNPGTEFTVGTNGFYVAVTAMIVDVDLTNIVF